MDEQTKLLRAILRELKIIRQLLTPPATPTPGEQYDALALMLRAGERPENEALRMERDVDAERY